MNPGAEGEWEELEKILNEKLSESPEPDAPPEVYESVHQENGKYNALWLPPSIFMQFLEKTPPSPSATPGEALTEEAEEEEADEGWLLPWWVLGLLLFGFGDTFTSIMVFARGGIEANPLFAFLMRMVGNNILSFVLVKTGLLTLLVFLTYIGLPLKSRGVVPLLLIAAGTFLTVRNTLILLTL